MSRAAVEREPQTAEALTDRNIRTIVDLERSARVSCSTSDRVAGFVARFCGTMTFVCVHFACFALWIGINVWPGVAHPDPYPFNFLTVVVSLEAIFLSAFILISQNQENRISDRRSQLDLQINLLTEQENTKMLRMLESIAEKIGADVSGDPDIAVLEQATKPGSLVAQLERAEDAVDELHAAPTTRG